MNLNGCWECKDFEVCRKLDFLKLFHGGSIINNLKEIKKREIVADWIKFRDKLYPYL